MATFLNYDPSTNPADTPEALIGALIAETTTLTGANFSDITVQGTPGSTSFYDGSISELAIGAGLLLTTGGTPGLINTSTGFSVSNDLPGDPQLNGILSDTTSFDATELVFTLNVTDATVNSLQFSVVFGSEEYPEYVDFYPDIAAVFVNGTNYALFNNQPDQPLSVSSNNLSAGNFQNNAGSLYAPIEYDGVSKLLTFIVPIKQGANAIKIAIADLNDSVLDSGMFISGFKLISNGGGGGLFSDVNGDEKPNTLEGNNNDQIFNGGGGDDTINGGGGDDVLNGDAGDDKSSGDGGNDEINGGEGDNDAAEFSGNCADYLITLDKDTGYLIVEDKREGSPDGQDKVGPDVELLKFADKTVPTSDYFEAGPTVFFSTVGDDIFTATETIDTVSYEQAENGVKVQLAITTPQKTGQGIDTLTGINNLTGSLYADKLTGNAQDNEIKGLAGDDKIDGAVGADTMIGGAGNDGYFVDNAGDVVSENAGEGYDAITTSLASYTLADNVEKLTLVAGGLDAIGNEGDNSITGNTGPNAIEGLGGNDKLSGGSGEDTLDGGAGNDKLDGGTGVDGMFGGLGDDGYTVDNAGDLVIEVAGEGYDSVNASVSYTLTADVEKLTLTGTAAIDGTGNEADNSIAGNAATNTLKGLGGNDKLTGEAGNDTLEGGAGNDKLDGGIGVDAMTGGIGDDGYTVDNALDQVSEAAGEGYDSVFATVSHTLAANVEKLTLGGTSAIAGTGNDLANTLLGNAGANSLSGLGGRDSLTGGDGDDTLSGGLGGDKLTGGAGADAFRFDVLETAANFDTVRDFVHGIDRIEVSRAAFTAFAGDAAGVISAAHFSTGAAATTVDQHLIYNTVTGALFYDADGVGGVAQVQIALITGHPALTATDIVLI